MGNRTSIAFENNSLDPIRLFAALQIAVTHYLNLEFFYHPANGWTDRLLLMGKRLLTLFPGLVILFGISGFLMGASLDRIRRRSVFFRRRFFRIYPGLWGNIVFTAALVCILFRPDALQIRELIAWIGVQFTGVAYTPDFLAGFGTGSINGTLWTIMVEMQFYLLLLLLWDRCRNLSARGWKLLLAFSILANLACFMMTGQGILPDWASAVLDRTFLPYLVWFVTGMFLYHFREKALPLLLRCLPVLTACYLVYKGIWQRFDLPVPGYYTDLVTSLLLPCLSIGWAYWFGRHRWKKDLSYGIFLYHWPFINLIFFLGLWEKWNHVLLLLGYLCAFLLMAHVSWYGVEKRFVELGKKETG